MSHTIHSQGKKKKPKSPEHVCGMMAMQRDGGIGYDDLNKLMKQPQDLEFIIELLSVDLPDSYAKESWQMDGEEKLKSVSDLRKEGNELYGQKRLKEAEEKYADAIGRLEQLMLRYSLFKLV